MATTTSEASLTFLGVPGSLRAGSFNRALLRAAAELCPKGVALHMFGGLGEIPLYNADVEARGDPEPVTAFKSAIASADALLIATPEYNYGIPGPLKNAIDWASRPPNQSWQDKPVAIFSVTPGPLGGARVQYDLRRILGQLWAHVLPRPEVFIGASASKFADGKLTDETTRKFLTELLAAFKPWVERMKVKK